MVLRWLLINETVHGSSTRRRGGDASCPNYLEYRSSAGCLGRIGGTGERPPPRGATVRELSRLVVFSVPRVLGEDCPRRPRSVPALALPLGRTAPRRASTRTSAQLGRRTRETSSVPSSRHPLYTRSSPRASPQPLSVTPFAAGRWALACAARCKLCGCISLQPGKKK